MDVAARPVDPALKPKRLAQALVERLGWLFAFSLVLFGVANFSPCQRIDLLLYDTLEPWVRSPSASPQTAIIAIDDASLAGFGRWPWTRDIHAQLIDRLSAAGVRAIGVAVLFPEPVSGDALLADSLSRSGRVVLAVAPGPVSPDQHRIREIMPVPALAAGAVALGHVDVELDADALVRRTFRYAGAATARWSALSLAVYQFVNGQGQGTYRQDVQPLKVSREASHWVRAGEMLLPYPDDQNVLPVYAAIDVLNDPDLVAGLRGSTVFIGATAIGLAAGLMTPNADNASPMSAVEFHARAYEALRNDQVYSTVGSLSALLLSMLMLIPPTIVLSQRLPLYRAMIGSIYLLFPLLVSALVLKLAGLWLPPTAAMLGFLVAYLWWFAQHLQRTHRRLGASRRNASATLRSIADAVITLDSQARVVLLNPVAEKLIGVTLGQANGQQIDALLDHCCAEAVEIKRLLKICLDDQKTLRPPEPFIWTRPDGRRFDLRATLTPIDSGRDGVVVALSDVTEARILTSRLLYDATHDPLTGLPNRTLLLDRLRQSLASSRRNNHLVAILFIDLDRFKRINDSLGHDWGDRVLKIVAERLVAAVRAADTVARWGGDEFIVLMDDFNDRGAVASVASKIIDLLNREVDGMAGGSLMLSGSVGISIGPQDSDDADTLLSMADEAMYRGKQEGGGSIIFYSSVMNSWSRDRLRLENALRLALANQEFELFYQPQIDIANGHLVGFESLIRWKRPDSGLIGPSQFIPAAEECGLIRGIGDWVIDEATTQLARWQSAGLSPVPVALNISARQCVDTSIILSMRSALAEKRLSPSLLKIELTESTAMYNPDFVATLLGSVGDLGIGIAVDDFGTGYSSLSYLKRFPISELKIDRSFVSGIAVNTNDAAIVCGTIALAHGMGMTVVAEGVETQSQLDFLAGHQCNTGQGYFFARPLTASEARRFQQAGLGTVRPI